MCERDQRTKTHLRILFSDASDNVESCFRRWINTLHLTNYILRHLEQLRFMNKYCTLLIKITWMKYCGNDLVFSIFLFRGFSEFEQFRAKKKYIYIYCSSQNCLHSNTWQVLIEFSLVFVKSQQYKMTYLSTNYLAYFKAQSSTNTKKDTS